jgi:hypothetical protein
MIDRGLVLFVYRRPEHTRRVLEGIQANDPEKLYVFADGPNDEDALEPIRETRDLVRSIDWCETDVRTFDSNRGLRETYMAGIDHVLERHEAVVALEDDCVPSKDFLAFMDRCLEYYADEERVMNVHGYCPPIEIPETYDYDVFFTTRSGSWGQGIWRDAWSRLVRDPAELQRVATSDELRRKLATAGADLLPILDGQISGEMDSIGIYWSWSLVKHDGLSVNPVSSRVTNIGFDGTGRHASDTNKFDTHVNVTHPPENLRLPDCIKPTTTLNNRYISYSEPNRIQKLKQFVGNLLLD